MTDQTKWREFILDWVDCGLHVIEMGAYREVEEERHRLLKESKSEADRLIGLLKESGAEIDELKAELEHLKSRKLTCGECGNTVVASNQMSYLEEITHLREGLAEVIRNSSDILAKKHCSQVLSGEKND